MGATKLKQSSHKSVQKSGLKGGVEKRSLLTSSSVVFNNCLSEFSCLLLMRKEVLLINQDISILPHCIQSVEL